MPNWFFSVVIPIVTMVVGAVLGVLIGERRARKRKEKDDLQEELENSHSPFSGVWGQFIYRKGDDEYGGKVVKRDEYILTHLTQKKYPAHLIINIKGSIFRIRDTDPYKIGNREGRKWECIGYCDNNILMFFYKALEPDDTKGCVFVKLSRDGEYRGYYIADHTQSDDTRQIDKTPVILKKMHTRYAVFDWDNTVRRGFTIFPWIDHLFEKGVFDDASHRSIQSLNERYRMGAITHDEYAERVGVFYAQGLKGKPVSLIETIENDYISQDRQAFFPEIQKLFDDLNDMGIEILVVSGAPHRILRHYQDELHIKRLYSFQEREKNGIISGDVEYNYGFNKSQIMSQIFQEYGCAPYMAFGDSESDYPLLENALYPFFISKLNQKSDRDEFVLINDDEIYKQITRKIGHLK